MVRLLAAEPFAGQLPLAGEGLRVEAHDPGPMWLIHGGGEAAGLPLPGPNRVSGAGDVRLIWMGPGQALLMGAAPPEGVLAVDQSDGWALARLTGPAGPRVLARLVPLDLRAPQFAPGETVRTLIGHMTGSVCRVDGETLEVMVMRSMAGTLVHDLQRAILTSER